MKLVEGKCPSCYGNLILHPETRTADCEDCDYRSTKAPTKGLWSALELLADDYGPKELRQSLTFAGKVAVSSFRNDEAVTDSEVWEAYRAHKGLVSDPAILARLRTEGLIE